MLPGCAASLVNAWTLQSMKLTNEFPLKVMLEAFMVDCLCFTISSVKLTSELVSDLTWEFVLIVTSELPINVIWDDDQQYTASPPMASLSLNVTVELSSNVIFEL